VGPGVGTAVGVAVGTAVGAVVGAVTGAAVGAVAIGVAVGAGEGATHTVLILGFPYSLQTARVKGSLQALLSPQAAQPVGQHT
jgi:hypothetical protein